MANKLVEDYIKLKVLGEGTYGVVYKCKHAKTGEVVAIKKILFKDPSEGLPISVLREVSALKELLGHPNIMELQNVLMPKDKMFLVFEYMPMDLRKFINSYGVIRHIPLNKIKSLVYQLLTAILFCHTSRFVHRDLKPENILLDASGNLKVADFGLARAIQMQPGRVYTHEVQTLWYRAPEILLGDDVYEFPVDLWAVGCIFAELTRKKPLFAGEAEIAQLFEIFRVLGTPTEEMWSGVSSLPDFNKRFPQWKQSTLAKQVPRLNPSPEGTDLLTQFLTYDPKKRISAKEAIDHVFFAELKTPPPAASA